MALGLRLRSIVNDIAAVIIMCKSKGSGLFGATDDVFGHEVISEVENDMVWSWVVGDVGGAMVVSGVICVGKARSKVIDETVGSQVAGDTDIEMAGSRVSVEAGVSVRVGVSIDVTVKALPALIPVFKSAKTMNIVLVFQVT